MYEIVEKNLVRMRSFDKGGMTHLLIRESFGGNAGTFQGVSCAGANFFYDRNTGEIIYFGNWQNVPEMIRDSYASGIFRVAMSKHGIVSCRLSSNTSHCAEQTLEETIKQYNEAEKKLS